MNTDKYLYLYVMLGMSIIIGIMIYIHQYSVAERWQQEARSTYNEQMKEFYQWKTPKMPQPKAWWFEDTWFHTACVWVQLTDSIMSVFGVIIPIGILIYTRKRK